MRKLSVLLLGLLVLTSCKWKENDQQSQALKVSAGSIEHIENFNSEFISPRNIEVWLPKNYNPGQKYSSLYMMDGQMLFDSTTTWNRQEWGVDETMDQLLSEKEIKKTIVIAIWNAGASRHAEYFPQKPFEALPQQEQDSLLDLRGDNRLFAEKVYSDDFLKFLVKELIPYVELNYSVKQDDRYIAGSSMGGLISWYAVCEYPGVFDGAACLSTHWPGNFETQNNPIPDAFLAYLDSNLPPAGDHKFYFDYGTETLDAMYEPYQQKVDSLMKAHGYSEVNWKTKEFEGADHSENSWKKRLKIPLRFLLKE